ncbi:unnamed protein product [Nesidiocoris tenuis]|uniref:Uncharacterized protein n=1 Tax=Nesidiocoris tenuis TaxID=355587 RepID=A0A6H5GPL0_9HEMI|nr:unnamed protein product [Nesidiocoris tenuis]
MANPRGYPTCTDLSDIKPLCKKKGMYLKPLVRLNISVQLPKTKSQEYSISNHALMEAVRQMALPDEFCSIKTTRTSVDMVRFEAEVEMPKNIRYILSRLDGEPIKLKGYLEQGRVRASIAKNDFPSRHDWDSFFRDAKHMNELKAGERPDTIHVQDLPVDWFVTKSSDGKPCERLVCRIFEQFGAISAVDIPSNDPYRSKMGPHISGIKQFNFSSTNLFETYVQYKDYVSFVCAMDALRGMKLLKKDQDEAWTQVLKMAALIIAAFGAGEDSASRVSVAEAGFKEEEDSSTTRGLVAGRTSRIPEKVSQAVETVIQERITRLILFRENLPAPEITEMASVAVWTALAPTLTLVTRCSTITNFSQCTTDTSKASCTATVVEVDRGADPGRDADVIGAGPGRSLIEGPDLGPGPDRDRDGVIGRVRVPETAITLDLTPDPSPGPDLGQDHARGNAPSQDRAQGSDRNRDRTPDNAPSLDRAPDRIAGPDRRVTGPNPGPAPGPGGTPLLHPRQILPTSTIHPLIQCEKLCSWWIYSAFRRYFPHVLVKTADLPAEKNYLLCLFPHGIFVTAGFAHFTTNRTDFNRLFPGLTTTFHTLNSNFVYPFARDWSLGIGKSYNQVIIKSQNWHLVSRLLQSRLEKKKFVAFKAVATSTNHISYPQHQQSDEWPHSSMMIVMARK